MSAHTLPVMLPIPVSLSEAVEEGLLVPVTPTIFASSAAGDELGLCGPHARTRALMLVNALVGAITPNAGRWIRFHMHVPGSVPGTSRRVPLVSTLVPADGGDGDPAALITLHGE